MKICLLGDTHIGIRNDSKVFHAFYEKFYDEVLFPYLKTNEIKTIIQLGDLFDRRKYINFFSLAESRRYFFDRLKQENIRLHVLVGNHDIFWRQNLSINSPDLLLRDYDNITLWDSPGTLTIDELCIDMIPWMCNDNESEIQKFISSSVSPICIGHFELLGFQMSKGVESHEGIDSKFLDSYDHVYSGHYHTKSEAKNITYIGTPYELFWNDYNDTKVFGVLDTVTHKCEYIENPNKIFYKVHYDDSISNVTLDYDSYTNTYVKVIVINKQQPYLFDKMLDDLYKASPIDITIVEDFTEANLDDIDAAGEEVDQSEDTLTILSNYIDQQKVNVGADKLKTLMRELYVEALSIEEL